MLYSYPVLRIWIRMDPELFLDPDPEFMFRFRIQQKMTVFTVGLSYEIEVADSW